MCSNAYLRCYWNIEEAFCCVFGSSLKPNQHLRFFPEANDQSNSSESIKRDGEEQTGVLGKLKNTLLGYFK